MPGKRRKAQSADDPNEFPLPGEGTNLFKTIESKLSPSPNAVLTHESCYQRLELVELEKKRLEEYVTRVSTESRIKLEAGLGELKQGLDFKLNELTEKLADLYRPEPSVQSSREKSNRKIFFPNESLLSKMLHYEDENYKTIFNIMICVMVLWGLSLALDDYDRSGLPNFDLLIWGIFRDIEPFVKYWLIMFTSSFFIVLLAHFSAEANSTLCSFVFTSIYVLFQGVTCYYSAWVVNSREVAFAMPLAVGFMAEQARISMKMHAYFREKLLWDKFEGKFSSKPKSLGVIPLLGCGIPEFHYFVGELEKYYYFMFVPTLVYRESYPRTTRIRWSFVLIRVAEAIGIVYYAFLVFRQVLPQFRDTAGQKMELKFFVRATFNCMGPAMASMVFTHFLVLHVVQNIGAELTRFADRKFYGDWWNSRTFSVFYRKWNGVVHDWIHAYLYSDMKHLLKVPTVVALLSSFIISAIIHEYLICIAMGFFLPILGILFTGPGLIFILLTKNKTARIWNIFMWLMLSIGNAMLMVIYCREYFARTMGPKTYELTGRPWAELGLYDFFIPRTFRTQFPHYFNS